ncbi:Pentapeptide repeat [Trinorchestia longiramus]|nr:Pentapeptide repeat [Trinorchestia longiramus]
MSSGVRVKDFFEVDNELLDCDLAGCDLAGCDFVGCDLAGCDFVGCDLAGCDLAGCDLAGCDLAGCDLAGCDLAGCDLAGCDLDDLAGFATIHGGLIGTLMMRPLRSSVVVPGSLPPAMLKAYHRGRATSAWLDAFSPPNPSSSCLTSAVTTIRRQRPSLTLLPSAVTAIRRQRPHLTLLPSAVTTIRRQRPLLTLLPSAVTTIRRQRPPLTLLPSAVTTIRRRHRNSWLGSSIAAPLMADGGQRSDIERGQASYGANKATNGAPESPAVIHLNIGARHA